MCVSNFAKPSIKRPRKWDKNNSLIEMHGIGFVGVDDIDVVVDSNDDGIDDNYHVGAVDGTGVDDVDEDDGTIEGNDGVDDHCHDGAVDGTDL